MIKQLLVISIFVSFAICSHVLINGRPVPIKDVSKYHNYSISEFNLHLADIHFYSGDLESQYIAHHFCNSPQNGIQQCLLFDGLTDKDRMVGTEYVISKEVFERLPEYEKPLWHSHVYEVTSGLLVAPELSPEDEWRVMEWLVGTYGKVVDTWKQGEDLPIHPPRLTNALALDSQVDWDIADLQDKILKLKTTHRERREQRKGLIIPEKARGADQYLVTGKAPQFFVKFFTVENCGKLHPKNKNRYSKISC